MVLLDICCGVRDFTITTVFYGGWHYLLYENKTILKKLKNCKFKYDDYNDEFHWRMNRFWTYCGTLILSVYEIVFLYMYKNHTFGYYMDFWQYPIWTLCWMYVVPFWQVSHFYWIHRLMHPWFKAKHRFDVGRFLYIHVHYIHHKS